MTEQRRNSDVAIVAAKRDLRDPTELGNKLLTLAESVRTYTTPRPSLSQAADVVGLHVRDYASPEHPHQKYGDPRKIPSTMPNAVE